MGLDYFLYRGDNGAMLHSYCFKTKLSGVELVKHGLIYAHSALAAGATSSLDSSWCSMSPTLNSASSSLSQYARV